MKRIHVALFAFSLLLVGASCGQTSQISGRGDHMVQVKVLSIKGCEATPPTIELVQALAKEMNIAVDLHHVVVETAAQAQEERFIGSPTVRINGRDIEPAARAATFFGVT